MLRSNRKRKATGAALIVIGVLFLLVSNDVLLGWRNVWPLFAILAGMLLLRVYARNRTPEVLFGGLATLLMGLFLLLFSFNILAWGRMDTLWPVIPAIAGVSLLAMAVVHFHGTASLILSIVILLFSVLGFLHEGGVIDERVVSPFVRLWPLVLVAAGIVLLRTRVPRDDADLSAIREVLDAGSEGTARTPEGPDPAVAPTAAGRPEQARGAADAPPPPPGAAEEKE